MNNLAIPSSNPLDMPDMAFVSHMHTQIRACT
jgi:hypothetical protein